MKPYAGRGLTDDQSVFNYRLSRARRTIENAFGILSARWRIFRKPIRADTSTVDVIVKAAICLHNYLLSTENARYTPNGFVDSHSNEMMVLGDWRTIADGDQNPALGSMTRIASMNYRFDAKTMRDNIKCYVNSEEGAERCPWQFNHVRSCGLRVATNPEN